MVEQKKILIVTGGSLCPDFAADYLKRHTFHEVIAADAGLDHCKRLGITPTVILGDFDSLKEKELLDGYRKKGVRIECFPTRKDYTDTHLAMELSIKMRPSQVHVLGATGTRIDHTLANIGLLTRMADEGIECLILDDHNVVQMLKGPDEKIFQRTKQKSYVSLLACSKEVKGITLTGFSYPLHDAVMHAFDSLGISNEIAEDKACLKIDSGYLLVIRSTDDHWRLT